MQGSLPAGIATCHMLCCVMAKLLRLSLYCSTSQNTLAITLSTHTDHKTSSALTLPHSFSHSQMDDLTAMASIKVSDIQAAALMALGGGVSTSISDAADSGSSSSGSSGEGVTDQLEASSASMLGTLLNNGGIQDCKVGGGEYVGGGEVGRGEGSSSNTGPAERCRHSGRQGGGGAGSVCLGGGKGGCEAAAAALDLLNKGGPSGLQGRGAGSVCVWRGGEVGRGKAAAAAA